MTQFDPAAAEDWPLLLDPLPTATDEPEPPGLIVTDEPPPGLTVVEPLSPFDPVVIVVELPSSLRVTTRHRCPLTMTVPSGPDAAEILSATAGIAAASNPMAITAIALFCLRITKSSELGQCRAAAIGCFL